MEIFVKQAVEAALLEEAQLPKSAKPTLEVPSRSPPEPLPSQVETSDHGHPFTFTDEASPASTETKTDFSRPNNQLASSNVVKGEGPPVDICPLCAKPVLGEGYTKVKGIKYHASCAR